MPSQKLVSILLSRTDLTMEDVVKLGDAEAWAIIYSMRERKEKDDSLEVCFTGFGASKKEELTALASSNNFRVVTSVTKRLDFLCVGENAGPKKVEKAVAQGVECLTEDQFRRLAATGELPRS